jgi:hypothetical protein
MKKALAAGALLLLLAGCTQVDSGTILNRKVETGRTEYDCDGKGAKKRCGWETLPDKCMFELDNGKERGWLEVSCTAEFNEYREGEHYPR